MLQSEGRSAVVARDQEPHVPHTTRNLSQNIGLVPLDAVSPAEKPDLPLAIEDYALIGDRTTAALVGRNGSIDWLCWPRFDSTACFAALLGTSEHGRWKICPADPAVRVSRAYRDGTMVLETVFETADGCVALIDFMPIGQANSSVIRLVEGRRGNVAMRLHLTLRFDYGANVPWVTQLEDKSGLTATAGPGRVVLRAPLPLQGEDLATVAEFNVVQGECVPFVLTHVPSHLRVPWTLDWRAALQQTEAFWRGWSDTNRAGEPGDIERRPSTCKGWRRSQGTSARVVRRRQRGRRRNRNRWQYRGTPYRWSMSPWFHRRRTANPYPARLRPDLRLRRGRLGWRSRLSGRG
jgi:Domain of unknown function (DUF5911)